MRPKKITRKCVTCSENRDKLLFEGKRRVCDFCKSLKSHKNSTTRSQDSRCHQRGNSIPEEIAENGPITGEEIQLRRYLNNSFREKCRLRTIEAPFRFTASDVEEVNAKCK